MGETASPAEVFGLLADDIRVDILEALAVAQHEATGVGPISLSFSTLYEQVDVENTAKFSYHLGELTGTFLAEDEEGYTFTHAGEKIVRMILAGNYERPTAVEPIETDDRCQFCGSTGLEAALAQQYFEITCPDCEQTVSAYPVAPTQLRSLTGEALLESTAAKQVLEYRHVCRGICPACNGTLTTNVLDEAEFPLPEWLSFVVRDDCDHCLRVYNAPLPTRIAYHPAAVAFHWEHELDVEQEPMWRHQQYMQDDRWNVERPSDDSAAYNVIYRHDDEALHVYLEADLTVSRTERVRGRSME